MNEVMFEVMLSNLTTTTQLPLLLATASTEAWFNEQQAGIWGGAVGGGVFGGLLIGGIGGGVCGPLAGAGKARRFVMSYVALIAVLSLTLLGTGIYAIIAGQPYHVWYVMMLLGTLGTFFGIGGFFLFRHIYSRAEQRKLDAASLRTT